MAYRGPHQLTAALSAHPLNPCLADGLPLYALQPRPVPPAFSLQKPEPSAQIQATAGPRPEDISDLVLDMAFWEGASIRHADFSARRQVVKKQKNEQSEANVTPDGERGGPCWGASFLDPCR